MSRKLVRYESAPLPAPPGTTIALPAEAAPPPRGRPGARALTFLIIVTCFLVPAAAYLLLATPIHRSTARLTVEQNDPSALESVETFLYRHRELIQSAPVLTDALERVGIADMEMFAQTTDPVGDALEALDVTVGDRQEVVVVSVDSQRPREGEALVGAIIEAYRGYLVVKTDSDADEHRTLLQAEMQRWDEQRDATRLKIQAFESEHGELDYEGSTVEALAGRVRDLGRALTKAEQGAQGAESAYELARVAMSDPQEARLYIDSLFRNETITDDAYGKAQNEVAIRLAELKHPSQNRKPNHPRIITLKKEIAAFQKELDRKIEEYRTSIPAEFDRIRQAAHRDLEKARKTYEENKQMLADQAEVARAVKAKAAELNELKRDLEQIEIVRQDLFEKFNALAVEQPQTAVQIDAFDPARSRVVWPRPTWVLGGALGIGAVVGLLAVHVRELRRGRPVEPKDTGGSAVLAVVPRIGDEPTVARAARIAWDEPGHVVSEAIRAAQTSIAYALESRRSRTLLVSSPSLADGRTTIAANLAIAMAQQGRQVLLVDADLHHPVLHDVFEIDGRAGLVDVLSGQLDLDDAVCPTGVPQLSVMPRGGARSSPLEVAGLGAFTQMVAQLEERFHYVVIDTMPVLAAPDAAELGRVCDAVLLVGRSTGSSPLLADQARQVMAQAGAQVLGVVVNGAPQMMGAPQVGREGADVSRRIS